MVKSEKVPKGFPMGIKVNEEDINDVCTLDALIEASETYHGGKYIIGYDSKYVDKVHGKPHYHIHWFSNKDTTTGAMGTFRSDVFKKKFNVSKSFRFYTGQDLPSADPSQWLGYCIKEKYVNSVGIELTDDIKLCASTQLEIKRLKSISSEKKSNEKKEKQEFKEQMFKFVKSKIPLSEITAMQDYSKVIPLMIQYLIDNEKYTSCRKIYLDSWYLEYMCKHSDQKWNAENVHNFIYGKQY